MLPHVWEESVLLIAEAISNLPNLRELSFSINDHTMGGREHFSKYFQDTLKCETPLQPRGSRTWDLDIGKYFQRLQNLENFIFHFEIVPSDSGAWFAKFIETLGNLKRLRKIYMSTWPGEKVKQFELKFVPVIKEWDSIREICLAFNYTQTPHNSSNSHFFLPDPLLKVTINSILKKQATRSDLMF